MDRFAQFPQHQAANDSDATDIHTIDSTNVVAVHWCARFRDTPFYIANPEDLTSAERTATREAIAYALGSDEFAIIAIRALHAAVARRINSQQAARREDISTEKHP